MNSFVTPDMNPDDVERIRQSLGLDQPIYVQYFIWLGNLLQGNLGYSIVNSQPVLQQILERIPATLGFGGNFACSDAIIIDSTWFSCGELRKYVD